MTHDLLAPLFGDEDFDTARSSFLGRSVATMGRVQLAPAGHRVDVGGLGALSPHKAGAYPQ